MNLKELGHGTFPYTLQEKLAIVTEPHEWFKPDGASPWGRPILPPETIHSIMFPQGIRGAHPAAVGLLGGCELRLRDGPVRVGEQYELDTEILAIGETPRTEFYWTKSTLYRTSTGAVVGEHLLQSMSLKGSFPGPAELGYSAAAGTTSKGARL